MFTEFESRYYISNAEIIDICSNVLSYYDHRLMHHGERVAYIASQIHDELGDDSIDLGQLLLLSILHDIGAFKTEDVDKLVQFECEGILPHCVYGYLLVNLSKLFDQEHSKVLLYHHICDESNRDFPYKAYSDIIFLCDRLDMALIQKKDITEIFKDIKALGFEDRYIKALEHVVTKTELLQRLKGTDYVDYLKEYVLSDKRLSTMVFDVLKLLVLTVDFKSKNTMVHAFATEAVCKSIADRMLLEEKEAVALCFAAFIHDIGKIAIPSEILESQGRLSDQEMETMKTHVRYTEKILMGVLPDNILQIALNHHEKLNGSGYPRGLSGTELSTSDRILAIADIFSALTIKRSYKRAYVKDETVAIFRSMAQDDLIDSAITELVIHHFDEIYREMEGKTAHYMDFYESLQTEYQLFRI